MKKLHIYIFAAIVVGLVVGLALFAGNNNTNNNSRSKVAATIFPIYDIARNVAGDNIEVELLLPPGASPHFYEFTPRQLAKLEGTELIFAVGHGLDNWAFNAEKSIDGVEGVTVSKGINLRETIEEEHEEEEEEHDHEGIDPHYWLHFGNARIIADIMAERLSGIDPENASSYWANAEEYKDKLSREEDALKKKTENLASRNFITLHDSWYYFAENFNLNIVGTFEPSAGEVPSPRYLANLQQEAKNNEVKVLFSEPQYSNSSLRPFLEDNNLELAVLDPIGGVEGRSSYIELMRYNVNTILGVAGNNI